MPTYDYKCQCGNVLEKNHKMSDTPVVTCPKCNQAMKKQVGCGSNVVFKGPGFYCNDYPKQ